MFRKTTLIILFIGLGMLFACSSMPSVKDIPRDHNTVQITVSPFGEQVTVSSNDGYIIGPGDILAIDVWKEPDLSKQVAVRLDGKISLPLLNDVSAAGITCTELRDQLTEQFKGFVENPEISVTLVESRSSKIYILGKINGPGEYSLQKNMTILQAICLAGGLAEWADASDIRLIRQIRGVEKTFKVDYEAIVSGEDLALNIQLHPNDTIFVP